jgi:hypothetical protein
MRGGVLFYIEPLLNDTINLLGLDKDLVGKEFFPAK